MYFKFTNTQNVEDGLESILKFYHKLEKGKTSLFQKLTSGDDSKTKLEQVLQVRLKNTNLIFKQEFDNLITKAFLFIDVLAFDTYLRDSKTVKWYASYLEKAIIKVCFHVIDKKENKTEYDHLLLELFKGANKEETYRDIDLSKFNRFLERSYLLDLCCLALWDETQADVPNPNLIPILQTQLNCTPSQIKTAFIGVSLFSTQQTNGLSLFNYTNPVKEFYHQSSRTVKLLVLRNKNRIIQELTESKELMLLIGQSALRDLSEKEKEKMKAQLLDLCKTVPSLTIFLLPGGTLLLPLLAKFIPQLLPSAFDENRLKN